LTHNPDSDRRAAIELRSWYEGSLRPRLARAARLGLVDEGRLQTLDEDLTALTGGKLARSAYDGASDDA
jgi:hypothetical protein